MLTPQEIQQANQATGNNVPTTGAPAVQSRADQIRALGKTAVPATPPAEPGFASRVGTDLSARGKQLGEALASGQTPMSKGLQIVGQGAGFVGDIAGEAVKSAVGALPNAPAETAALKSDPLIQLGAHALQAGGDLWGKFQAAHPEIAGDVGALGNILALLPIGGGAKVAGKGVVEAIPKAVGEIKTGATAAKEAVMGTAEQQATKESTKVLDAIRPTEDTMTPAMKKEAIAEGRQTIKTTKLGGTQVDYTPTPEIQRASQILQDKNVLSNPVTSKDAPNVVLAKTQSAISRLGQNAETYLENNPVKITNAEDYKMFSDLRAKADKVSTPTEMKAYDEQITLFNKQLQGKGGYTTANYYKALKEWEANIADKLPRGKDALLDPTGVANAKLRAAADIRKTVRDLISSKHPDFQPQMYDLASLYEAKDVAIQNASKVKSQTLTEKHPILKKAVPYLVGGGVGAGIIHESGL